MARTDTSGTATPTAGPSDEACGPTSRVRRALLLAPLLGAMRPSWAAGAAPAGADAHADHIVAPGSMRLRASYVIPDVKLVRDDGRRVALADEMNDGRPVVLAFVYTSCTTVCPIISQTLAQLQDMLGPLRDTVHLMSVSIDPDHDTPARLRDYARRFGAGPSWQHYTGSVEASQSVQRAFNVYRGNKMEHQPATLIRLAPGQSWVRVDGFASARQLIAELPAVCSQQAGIGS